MKKSNIKETLYKHGFNRKQILIIRKYSLKEGVPFTKILSDLRKRFIGSCIMFLVMSGFMISEIFSEAGDIESYFVAMLIGAGVIFFLAPMPIAWKSYRFFKKNPHLLS
ncbi:hypothetical protein GQQ23_06145 [Pantoea agglomerans]|uniref:hypothetical protein n=1 Tax=Enterobacter agglomerans TaxID=549 RepID=UPI0013C9DE40|nr:hypothetical protein [Pantoea agglomerans]NEG61928.1 hypothetical protein [Pantoea agglomerans]